MRIGEWEKGEIAALYLWNNIMFVQNSQVTFEQKKKFITALSYHNYSFQYFLFVFRYLISHFRIDFMLIWFMISILKKTHTQLISKSFKLVL